MSVGSGIREPGAQAEAAMKRDTLMQPEEMTSAKLSHDLSEQELVRVFAT